MASLIRGFSNLSLGFSNILQSCSEKLHSCSSLSESFFQTFRACSWLVFLVSLLRSTAAHKQCSALQAHQQALEADLVLWTAGSGPATTSDSPADSGAGAGKSGRLAMPFPADRRGAIETDAMLRVVGAKPWLLG